MRGTVVASSASAAARSRIGRHGLRIVTHLPPGSSFRRRCRLVRPPGRRREGHGPDENRVSLLPDGSVRRVDPARHHDRTALIRSASLIEGHAGRHGIATGRALRAMVRRTSRGAGRAGTRSRSAAPTAMPRQRPIARKRILRIHRSGGSARAGRPHRARELGARVGASTDQIVPGSWPPGGDRQRRSGAGRVLCARRQAGMVEFVPVRRPPDLAPQRIGKASHLPWPSTPTRNSWFSLSTPPGFSATSSARKRARSARTAAAT